MITLCTFQHAVHNYGLELRLVVALSNYVREIFSRQTRHGIGMCSWAGRQGEAIRVLARSVQLNPTNIGNLHPLSKTFCCAATHIIALLTYGLSSSALAMRLDGQCPEAEALAHYGIHEGETQLLSTLDLHLCVTRRSLQAVVGTCRVQINGQRSNQEKCSCTPAVRHCVLPVPSCRCECYVGD